MTCRVAWRLGALLAGLGLPTGTYGAVAQFKVAQVQGQGWQAREVSLALAVDGKAVPSFRLQAASANLPAGLGAVRQLEIRCPRLRTVPGRWSCAAASLRGQFTDWGPQSFTAAVDYEPRAARLRIAITGTGLQWAGGSVTLAASLHDDRWRAKGRLAGARLERLEAATRRWVEWPAGQWAGPVSAELEAEGTSATLQALQSSIELPALGYASADGLTATESLAGTLTVGWQNPGALALRYVARGGQLYLDPVFLDAGTAPFTLEARGEWRQADQSLQGVAWSFRQPEVLVAHGTGVVNAGPGALLRSLEGTLDEVAVPRAWPIYVAPFLAATDLKEVQVTGDIGGSFGIAEGLPAFADLHLQGLSLAAPDGTAAWRGLTGRLHWRSSESESIEQSAMNATQLAWDGGKFYGLPFGAAAVKLHLGGRGMRLLEPLQVPIFDGGLRIETLRLRHAGEPRMWLRLDAEVLPIDMAQLSRAFGWPAFGGKLGGRIPKAALDDGILTLGGNLEADVFGGRVTIGNLKLQDALGRFPQLVADAQLSNLDLELLTGTFEFGYISGRLAGEVRNLQLFDWRPVAFDAWLATPADYRGPRRITPRAVQNLSSLGGGSGVTSVLSSGFLRFFDDFGYERLGIACRLERDVCRMGGVAAAPGGYYLIQGSGFPRINLIGSQGRVAWSKLLRQLNLLAAGAPLEVK